MTVSLNELGLYALASLVLFIVPGPVWVALAARSVAVGFRGAWPLALGVAVGDVAWSLLAIWGVGLLVAAYAGFLVLLRYFAAAMFVVMGLLLIRFAGKSLTTNKRLSRPGMWAGFVAGLLVILGNPKAILFYMGILPGFFDLSSVTAPDIVAIGAISALTPLAGNLMLALFVTRARRHLASPVALRRTNIGAGLALILVAVVIALS